MNSKKSKYNPWGYEEPETSDDYIAYAEMWLSGDAGWRSEDIREFLIAFRNIIVGELAESGKAPVLKTGDA